MKIFICASKYNYVKVSSVKEELERLGHVVTVPNSYDEPMKDWEIKNNKLYKLFSFADFVSAMKFINAVAELAEKENHHPDISIKYKNVELVLWTHDTGGITEKDYSLASKIDNIKPEKISG